MVVGSSLILYRGTWSSSTSYQLGDVVLQSGVLYQAKTDTTSTPGTTAIVAGHDNPGAWMNVSTDVLQLTGSTDPTTGAGIPAAIGSTYQRSGVGLLSKTGAGATAWSSSGGGGGSISATDGVTTVNPATSIQFPSGTLTDLGSGVAGLGLVLQEVGPFTIHYNDAGVGMSPGIELLALDAGSLILGVHVEVPTTWDDDADQASLGIVAVGNVTAGLGHFLLGDNWALGTPEAGTYNIGGSTSGTFPNSVLLTAPTFRYAVSGHLYAVVSNGDASTKGVATVYAIVASPAS